VGEVVSARKERSWLRLFLANRKFRTVTVPTLAAPALTESTNDKAAGVVAATALVKK